MSDATQAFGLEHLPGLGPALSRRIEQAYGGAAAFLDACRRLDLDRLLEVEGLSERRAYEIVAAMRNAGAPDLATTDRAKDVRRELEDLLASYAQTDHGRRTVRLLPTLRSDAEIRASLRRIGDDRARLEGLDRPVIARLLAAVVRLKEPRPSSTGRIAVVDGDEDEAELRRRGYDRWVRITTASDMRRVETSELVLDCTASGWHGDNSVRIGANPRPWQIAPEAELAFVEQNKATLEAITRLSEIFGSKSVAPQALATLLGSAPAAAADLRKAATQALERAQKTLEEGVARVSLTGPQILELLSRGLTKSVDEARSAAILEGRAAFRELSGLNVDPFERGLPLRIDDEELAKLEEQRDARLRSDAFEKAQRAAQTIQGLREALRAEVQAWFDYDVRFALAGYAMDFDAQPAKSANRLFFRRACHVRHRRKAEAQMIDYELGRDQPMTVLTGANSGGKTTLLELVAQLLILHHWGVPVPAQDAEIPLVRELVFLGATRSADAGAFESFLRELFPPLTRSGRKFLLLDEVENVTELEAAGRILGVFIDEAASNDCLGILVTHLPTEILAHAKTPIRVDGIDAVGLDEKFNLIVDRQPKLNHRARSTPELILRRVHSKSSGPVKELYAKVLGRWG